MSTTSMLSALDLIKNAHRRNFLPQKGASLTLNTALDICRKEEVTTCMSKFLPRQKIFPKSLGTPFFICVDLLWYRTWYVRVVCSRKVWRKMGRTRATCPLLIPPNEIEAKYFSNQLVNITQWTIYCYWSHQIVLWLLLNPYCGLLVPYSLPFVANFKS